MVIKKMNAWNDLISKSLERQNLTWKIWLVQWPETKNRTVIHNELVSKNKMLDTFLQITKKKLENEICTE